MRSKRRYALFSRPYGQRKWQRRSEGAYHKDLAVRMFQSALIAGALNDPENEWELRPVKN